MELPLKTYNKPVKLIVTIHSPYKTNMVIKGYDPNKKNTVYFDRKGQVQGYRNFIFGMPNSPEELHVSIYDEATGNQPIETSFKVINHKLINHNRQEVDEFNLTKSFIRFAEEFSEKAGELKPGEYISDDDKFRIIYLPVIQNKEGNELNTPARIHKIEDYIQVSQKMFKQYTVPMRMFILLHEFAHNFLNEQRDDEVEADLNAAKLYLQLGYPHMEAIYAFTKIFDEETTPNWRERLNTLYEFVDDWDQEEMKLFKINAA